MKTKHELFQILLSRFRQKRYSFICNEITTLEAREIITYKERLKLKAAFLKEKPTKRKNVEFYNHKDYIKNSHVNQGWFMTEEGNSFGFDVRVQFLEMLVEKTKPKSKVWDKLKIDVLKTVL